MLSVGARSRLSFCYEWHSAIVYLLARGFIFFECVSRKFLRAVYGLIGAIVLFLLVVYVEEIDSDGKRWQNWWSDASKTCDKRQLQTAMCWDQRGLPESRREDWHQESVPITEFLQSWYEAAFSKLSACRSVRHASEGNGQNTPWKPPPPRQSC